MVLLLRKIAKIVGVLIGILVVLAVYLFVDFVNFKDGAAPVLMYHGVGRGKPSVWGNLIVSPETFEAHLRYLMKSDYKVVSVEELADRLATNKSVRKFIAFTFDDGYANNYEHAYPLLKRYGATATFYIIRNALGNDIYMSDREISEMVKNGMKIGSHTMSHSNLTAIDKSFYVKEIQGSKMLLEQRYGVDVDSISYPYGAYNKDVLDEVMAARYKIGVGGQFGVNTVDSYNDNPYAMDRVGIYGEDTDAKGLAQTLERAYFVGYLRHRGVDVLRLRKIFKKRP